MKFLGVCIYASALLATIYAFPGYYRHHDDHDAWRHHHKGKKHHYPKEIEEIHYQVVDPTPPIKLHHTKHPETCPSMGASRFGQELSHFNGIFYKDFTTDGNAQDIHGPLAVGGNFHAPNYIVNSNHDIHCDADETSSFDSIGLVVAGDSTTSGTHVRGNHLIAGKGDASQYNQQLAGCRAITDKGTGHFDFPRSAHDADSLSQTMARIAPDSVLSAGGAINRVSTVEGSPFRVFKMRTCEGSCQANEHLSHPDEMLFGHGTWNGPSGDVPGSEDTVIINVPVNSGSTVNLRSHAPSHGFDSCRIVYNFYPVDKEGKYDSKGEFTLERQTGSQLEGLVLAPHGHIRDGNTGNFAGTVIGKHYAWLDSKAGAKIHDWKSAKCPHFKGCIPLKHDVPDTCTPKIITATETETEKVAEVTVTKFDTITETITEIVHDKVQGGVPGIETITEIKSEHHDDKDDEWTKWKGDDDKDKGDDHKDKDHEHKDKGDDHKDRGDDHKDKEDEWTKWDGDDKKDRDDDHKGKEDEWTKWDGEGEKEEDGDSWEDHEDGSW